MTSSRNTGSQDFASVSSLTIGLAAAAGDQGKGILPDPLNSPESIGAAQLNRPDVCPIIGSNEESQASNAACRNVLASMTIPTQGLPLVQCTTTRAGPTLYDPVRASEQSQHTRDDLQLQRQEAAAVQTHTVINNPLRAVQVLPDVNRAPCQETVQRYPVPWFMAPRAGDLAEMPIDVPVIYDGDESDCPICMMAFADGERVARLRCRHTFMNQGALRGKRRVVHHPQIARISKE